MKGKSQFKIPWSRKDWPRIAMLYFFFFWISGTWGNINQWLEYADDPLRGGIVTIHLIGGIASAVLIPIGVYFAIVMMRGVRSLLTRKKGGPHR